jgi:hypothetical protein
MPGAVLMLDVCVCGTELPNYALEKLAAGKCGVTGLAPHIFREQLGG